MCQTLEIAMLCLADTDQILIREYYYDGETQTEIGKRRKCSQQYAQRLISRATNRLRAILDELNA